MEGLWRPRFPSLRPPANTPSTPLPRALLRYLVTAGDLGIGSRVLVAGDGTPVIACFEYLGIDAVAVDAGPHDDLYDAVLWIGRNQAPPGKRSLQTHAAYDRTLRWIDALRPQGTLLLVNHLGRMTGGHEPECLRKHLAVLPGPSDLTVIPERPFLGFLRESARPAFAVAAWQVPERPLDPADCRERIARTVAFAGSCCRWSDESILRQRAA